MRKPMCENKWVRGLAQVKSVDLWKMAALRRSWQRVDRQYLFIVGVCTRNTWTTDITTTKGMKYYQLKRAAEDRKRWHGLVVNLAHETTLR